MHSVKAKVELVETTKDIECVDATSIVLCHPLHLLFAWTSNKSPRLADETTFVKKVRYCAMVALTYLPKIPDRSRQCCLGASQPVCGRYQDVAFKGQTE